MITPTHTDELKKKDDNDTWSSGSDPDEFVYLTEEQLQAYKPKTAPIEIVNQMALDERRKYKNVYCVNCGEKGHVVKDCDGPITSFGIMAFKVVKDAHEEKYDLNHRLQEILALTSHQGHAQKQYPKVKFLMIQRKDTMGYIDFVRGKYPDNDPIVKDNLLQVCLQEMTPQEKNNLLTKSFDTIWNNLWLNHDSKTFKNEYAGAKAKFQKLDVRDLVMRSKTYFHHTEFGFAKGRRNMRESNIGCAEREFYEETGFTKAHYDFIKYYPTIHEEFVGTNGIRYRHIYYLVKMKNDAPPPRIDRSNIVQMGEVQNIGWFTYDECMRLIRPYDHAKKQVMRKVNNDILEMNNNFICSSFYYNTKRNIHPFNPAPHIHDYRTTILKSRSI